MHYRTFRKELYRARMGAQTINKKDRLYHMGYYAGLIRARRTDTGTINPALCGEPREDLPSELLDAHKAGIRDGIAFIVEAATRAQEKRTGERVLKMCLALTPENYNYVSSQSTNKTAFINELIARAILLS